MSGIKEVEQNLAITTWYRNNARQVDIEYSQHGCQCLQIHGQSIKQPQFLLVCRRILRQHEAPSLFAAILHV